ncbi:E3 ubiquitin-protein ligase sina [Zootermopsis nevadensis]|uniref:E3 ubiquitin-protein ligase n=2 Tax=Zootermopsis nevadensis TaxID=136037 RepID=A0A067RQ60_ZOONE|nr:E3 ubiquitin-protein ligase sina [Zootermopsis nevadensis]
MGLGWPQLLKKNERSSSGGVAADSASELRKILRNILECPVCYELLRPPVLQCLNGHSLCGNCMARLNGSTCPICRGKMEGSRNLVAEELCLQIWYPCRHTRCSESFVLRDLDTHEATCAFRLYRCPLVTSWRSDGSVRVCAWTMPWCEALCHARQEHGNQVWRGRKHHVIDYNFTSAFQRLYLISAYEELFLWCGQYRPREKKFFGALRFEGSVNKASQFRYIFKISKCMRRETLKVVCPVRSTPFEDIFRNEGCCVILDLQTIKRFSDGDKMSFFLKIDAQSDTRK